MEYKEYCSEWNYIVFDNEGIHKVTEKIYTMYDNKFNVIESLYIREAFKLDDRKFSNLNDLLLASKL